MIVIRNFRFKGRGRKMFPIASQFLFETSSNRDKFCASKINGDNDGKRRTQFEIESILRRTDNCVTACGYIEKHFHSHQFKFDQVLIDNNNLPRKFSVHAQSDGLIFPQDQHLRNTFWIRNIRIADDIPGANILLHFHDDRVEVKAIKSININDELLMWFSEEVISFMGIPFLIPGNIQGES